MSLYHPCRLRSYQLLFTNDSIVKVKQLQLRSVFKVDTTLPVIKDLLCSLHVYFDRLLLRQMTSSTLLVLTQVCRARITRPASNALSRDGVNEIG
jgi:hypothetical protein